MEKTVKLNLKLTEKMRANLVEAVQLKSDAVNKALTVCLKEKQTDAANLIVKEVQALQELRAEIENA